VPVRDERVEGADVGRGERAGPGVGGQAQPHPPAQCIRYAAQLPHLHRSRSQVGTGLVGERVQQVGVGAQLGRGAGQRRADARAEDALGLGEQRPGAHPGVALVSIVRVEPPRQSLLPASGFGFGSGDRQQRSGETVTRRGHPGQRPRAGAAGQPEQHLLGLVVAGVPEQGDGGAQAGRGGAQRGIPGGAGSGLGAGADGGDLDPHHLDGAQPQRSTLRRGSGCGIRSTGLQPVVDDDGGGRQPQPGRFESHPRSQRERVGTAGACHEHRCVGGQSTKHLTHCEADGGNGGGRTGHRREVSRARG
jgi:hypothetical protein